MSGEQGLASGRFINYYTKQGLASGRALLINIGQISKVKPSLTGKTKVRLFGGMIDSILPLISNSHRNHTRFGETCGLYELRS